MTSIEATGYESSTVSAQGKPRSISISLVRSLTRTLGDGDLLTSTVKIAITVSFGGLVQILIREIPLLA